MRSISGKFVIAFLLLFAAQLQAAPWQSNDYILSSFDKIAVNGKRVNKWEMPIYYQIQHYVDNHALHEKIVTTHLKQLQRITGLNIQPAGTSHKANLNIILTTEKRFERDALRHFRSNNVRKIQSITKTKLGATNIISTTDGAIKQSTVIIPIDRARAYARLLTTFSEMLTKSVGLQYRSEEVFPSIFNHRSVDSYLTGLDYVMLKLLYDDRVKPGMNSRRLRQLTHTILKENNYQQHIAEANLAVKQSGLNALTN